ncbi:hypothetical protein Pla108_01010 [Botrimarina colliarenosi]|uniref:VWFA domain-containing protein n=1 Tax=Botrimarina colliarenosi TaxID=2528001 RepID=A0A5C6AI61_9BACT|nr:VWA domain-containing protein [Botrimarina colliarenosi]TWT99167.1 hypothetical protein Pla108_01010 [Botrimarina colliarenosi]
MNSDPPLDDPSLRGATPVRHALNEARRREKLSQAEWRRRRAEVARLVAAGEEAAARALLAEIGVASPADLSPEPVLKSAQPAADRAPHAATAPKPQSASGDAPQKEARLKKQTPHPATKAKRPQSKAKRPQSEPPGVSRGSEPLKRPTAQRRSPPRRVKRRAPRTWADWARQRPPWLTSLAAHGVLLTLFGLLSFATFGEPGFSLTASLNDNESWDDLPAEVTLTDLEVDSEVDLAHPIESVVDLAADLELASLVEPADMAVVANLGDVLAVSGGSLMAAVPATGGSKGEGDAAGGKAAGAPGKVSFFGAEANAHRVIFVVDNSGSMQDGRMETTLAELNQAVRRLSESQEFYVVFFSDQAYPLFFPEPVAESLPATQENKRRLTAWLRRVEMCVGGRILDAMELAASLEPDVVYLLTDGDIRSPYVIERMTTPGAWPFLVHTLGMGARTPEHLALLQAIAANTNGEYRPVGPNRVAIAQARNRLIPYHRTPGPVWGSAIKPWK